MKTKIERHILWICLIATSHVVSAQEIYTISAVQLEREAVSVDDNSDFNIFFHQDLENTQVGVYDYSHWLEDWNNTYWANSYCKRTLIVDYNTGGRI